MQPSEPLPPPGAAEAPSAAETVGGHAPRIRVGIGGWVFEPWRGTFYPEGLPTAQELRYASRRLSLIELNGTFYSTPSAASWQAWADAVPAGFVFSIKGPRAVAQRRVLDEGQASLERFFASGIEALGPHLGPIFWPLPPWKRFDADELARFFDRLPRSIGGQPLRHAVEARHASFDSPEALALLRAHRIGRVYSDEDGKPQGADATADFLYLRLMRADETRGDGLAPEAARQLADALRQWSAGAVPEGLTLVAPAAHVAMPRDVYAAFIRVGKPRAPQAAMRLREALGDAVMPADEAAAQAAAGQVRGGEKAASKTARKAAAPAPPPRQA